MSSIIVQLGLFCCLSVGAVLITPSELVAQTHFIPSTQPQRQPQRNDVPPQGRPESMTNGTGIGTTGTTIGTQRPTASTGSTTSLQDPAVNGNIPMQSGSQSQRVDQQDPLARRAPETSPFSVGSRSLPGSTAPFESAGRERPDVAPFGSDRPPPVSTDQPSGNSYRRYIDMPDDHPGSPPLLR